MPTDALLRVAAALLIASPATAQVARVESEGVTLSVRDAGEGDAVLLLTGGPGFSGVYLEHVAERLSDGEGPRYRVLLPDQRGTGESRPERLDPSQLSFDQAIADLEAVRTTTGIERWSIVGHSWGGILAMAYAAEHPGHVRNLVLVSPGGVEPSFFATYQQNLFAAMPEGDRQKLMNVRPAEPTPEAMAETARQANLLFSTAMVAGDEGLDDLRAIIEGDTFNPVVGMMAQQHLMAYDLSDSLAAYTGPATIIVGDRDAIGPDAIEGIADAIPQARRVTLENVGHWPFFEATDAFTHALDAALQHAADKPTQQPSRPETASP